MKASTLSNPDVVSHYQDVHVKAIEVNSDKAYPNLSMVRVVGKYFPTREGKVLDYGCGFGANLLHLLKLGYDVTGADTSPHAKIMIDRKVREFPSFSNKYDFKTINPAEKELPFEDNSFDYIVCASLLSLLSSKDCILNLLTEFKRVIKPGGRLFLDANGKNSEFAIFSEKIGDESYIYRGNNKNGNPIEVICFDNMENFSSLVSKVFKVDEVGVTSHRFFDYAEEEFIVCAQNS